MRPWRVLPVGVARPTRCSLVRLQLRRCTPSPTTPNKSQDNRENWGRLGTPNAPESLTFSTDTHSTGGGGSHKNTGATTIRVRGETKTASLSGWLTTRLRETRETLTLTTIGGKGVNQIIKAISVSQELLREDGELVCRFHQTNTITDDGSPASYFSISVHLGPPRHEDAYRGAAPHLVGKASQIRAMQQLVRSANQTGQVCVFAVAGVESTTKAVLAISGAASNLSVSIALAKNEEGEYTAIHVRVLPPPGAPKTLFISKFTKPAKLAGYIRHLFTCEESPSAIKLVASADTADAIRGMLKAAELASEYLEADRVSLTLTSELAEDDEALSVGSYVVTLKKERTQDEECWRVTAGLGNMESDRIAQQIKQGLEQGKIVLLRSTLQGTVPCLEALTNLNKKFPICFHHKPKEVKYSEGGGERKFYMEVYVEKRPTPSLITLPRKFDIMEKYDDALASLRFRDECTLKITTIGSYPAVLRLINELTKWFQQSVEMRRTVSVVFALVDQTLEASLKLVPPVSVPPSGIEQIVPHGRLHDLKPSELAKDILKSTKSGAWGRISTRDSDSWNIVLRAAASAGVHCYIMSTPRMRKNVDMIVPPNAVEEGRDDPLSFMDEDDEEVGEAADESGSSNPTSTPTSS